MIRQQILCIAILTFVFEISSAQNLKPIEQLVERVKVEKKSFKEIEAAIQVNSKKVNLEEMIDPSKVVLFDYNGDYFLREVAKEGKYISLAIPLEENHSITVDLVEVPETFYDYAIRTSSGIVRPSNSRARHYRGVVRGIENESLVALSFFEDELAGIISINSQGNYNVGKLKNKNTHIIFNDKNITQRSFVCETNQIEDDITSYTRKKLFESDRERSSQICVKMYFETDSDIFKHFDDSLIDVENYVMALFNEVATIYYNESMFVEISEIFIWDMEDPYPDEGIHAALNKFVEYRPSYNGDLAQLLTYRDNDQTLSARGAAKVDKLCIEQLSHSVTELFPSFEDYPIYSHQVQVVAHEMAHNIGSRHTHNCVWNGNQTQIDDYGSVSQNDIPPNPQPCYSEPGMFDVTPTIMSYYGSRGWGTYPLTNGFGEQPGNLLRNKIINADCLSACVGCFADKVEIFANDKDITYFPTVNIPCGETCFILSVTNLENIEYRVTGNVILGADGSVCIPQNTFESSSGLVEISGIDSCGEPFSKGILIKVEDCCPITTPTNLHVIDATLHWDPVINAESYIVSSQSLNETDCECEVEEVAIVPVQTSTNSFELLNSLKVKCFVWNVTAVCSDGAFSPVSEDSCYSPTTGFMAPEEKGSVTILPNPNNGVMNFKVETVYQTDITLRIYKLNGTLVETIDRDIKNGVTREWNGENLLQNGLYFFVFTTNRETIAKKVVIE